MYPVRSAQPVVSGGPSSAREHQARDRSWPPSRQSPRRDVRATLYVYLLLLDCASVATGFMLGNVLRHGVFVLRPEQDFVAIVLPLFLILAFTGQAYTLTSLERPRIGIHRVLRALVVSAAAIIGVIFYLKVSEQFSRFVFGFGFLFSAAFLTLGRYRFGRWAGARYNWTFVDVVLLVDGLPVAPARGQIVISADQLKLSVDDNDPLALERIGRLLAGCDGVVVSAPSERRPQWSRILKGAGVNVEVLAPELDHLGALQLGDCNGKTTVLISSGPLNLRNRIVKRLLDLAISVPTIVLLSPFLAVVACMIKLDSAGDIFFRQERVGLGNRRFRIFKFRTMHAGSLDHAGVQSTARQDARITRVGAWLRRSSIDELPQLFNVIKGDMSIVGPRPHALASTAEDTLFWHIDARYWERGAIKPGITGLAQIRGLRGATFTREDLTKRVQADLEYLAGWTVWRDVEIMLRTAKVLVHERAF